MKKTNSVRRCRLCACEEDSNNFFNIFDENSELELEMKITKLLPVVVMPWDPMSHMVCHRCIEKLNSFNEFYEASLKAERFLRTLHPSLPDSEMENCDPIVQVQDDSLVLNDNSLKLPPKKRQGLSESASRIKKCVSDLSGFDEISQNLQNVDKKEAEIYAERTLNCFIVTQITDSDSFFTCRNCCRTFTKQSSALMHSCVRLEDCREVETIDLEDDSKKSLPPLKIRLFSVRSGLFVCYLCQAPFEDKKKLVEHLKEHFLNGNREVKNGKKNNRLKGKRKGRNRDESEIDEDWEETYRKRASKRKRKNCSGPQRKGKAKSGGEETEESVEFNGSCLKCSQEQQSSTAAIPKKKTTETTESTTQYSEIKDEETCTDLTISPEEESTMTAKTEVDNIFFKSFEEEKLEVLEGSNDISDDLIEIPKVMENDSRSDEVTVLEVINNKNSTAFSCCAFCDKVFATKGALIVHQSKHLEGYSKARSHTDEKRVSLCSEDDGFLCSVCAMMFPTRKTLLEHEQYHLIDLDGAGYQKKIRIALAHDGSDREIDQEVQMSKGRERGIITITVTASEKKIPQIEFF